MCSSEHFVANGVLENPKTIIMIIIIIIIRTMTVWDTYLKNKEDNLLKIARDHERTKKTSPLHYKAATFRIELKGSSTCQ